MATPEKFCKIKYWRTVKDPEILKGGGNVPAPSSFSKPNVHNEPHVFYTEKATCSKIC